MALTKFAAPHRTFTAVEAAEDARLNRTVSEVDFDLHRHTA